MGEIGVIVIPTVVFDGNEPVQVCFTPPVVTDPAFSKQRTCVDDPARLAVGNNESRGVQAQGRITTGPDVVRKNSGETALRAMAWIVEVAHVKIAAVIKGQHDCLREVCAVRDPSRTSSSQSSGHNLPACLLQRPQVFPQAQHGRCAHSRRR